MRRTPSRRRRSRPPAASHLRRSPAPSRLSEASHTGWSWLRSFSEPVVLLLGGRDKNLPLEDLAEEAMRRCRAVLLLGESAEKLEHAFRKTNAGEAMVRRVDGLGEAVDAARGLAQPGDVVLLSPACTSYDAYDSFEHRGEHFRKLVGQMVKEAQPSLP